MKPLHAAAPAAAILVLAAGVASAHAVLHTVDHRTAVVVTATWPDGAPLSFERCRVTPPDTTAPLLAARTDRHGRVVFVPDRPGDWRVQVWTDDGHGLDITVPVTAALVPETAGRAAGPSRLLRVLAGAAIVLAAGYLLRRRPGPRGAGAHPGGES